MKYLVGTALALAIVAPAQADVFNGPRGGIQAGVETGKIDSATLFGGAGLGTATVDHTTQTGVTVQATIGYDATVFDNFVVGAELAGGYSSGRNKQVVTFSSQPTTPVNIDYKSDLSFEATVRAGFLVTPKVLLYVRGGYANTKLTADITSLGATPANVSGNNNGWLVGGGVEYAFSPRISGRIEYKYFDLDGPVTRQQILVGAGYSF